MRAADALERYCLRGCFFVTTNYIGAPGFLDASEIRELVSRRHVVGSHSCSHPLRMGHCSWDRLIDEWTISRSVLADIIGQPITVASVPGGEFAWPVADAAAAAGFTTLFTSEPDLETHRRGGLDICGRFTIQRHTLPATVAGLAAGAWAPRARQMVLWSTKKVTKRLAGERYLQIRKLILGHSREVSWGDQV
jgi:peptidoglycan/xylan/chitin deacetylase (PgdA/CDA1 family)